MYFRTQWEEISIIKQQFYKMPEAYKRQLFEQLSRGDYPKQHNGISELEKLIGALLHNQVITSLANRYFSNRIYILMYF